MKGVRKELVAAITRAAIFYEGSSVIRGWGRRCGELRVWKRMNERMFNKIMVKAARWG